MNKNKSTLTTWDYRKIILFITFSIFGGNAVYMFWRITFEPFFTNQLTTLTWFGIGLFFISVIVAWSCAEKLWDWKI